MASDQHVACCPSCGVTGIKRRNGNPKGSHRRSAKRYYCCVCGADFDEPASRPRRGHGTQRGSPHARALLDADPDELLTDGGGRCE